MGRRESDVYAEASTAGRTAGPRRSLTCSWCGNRLRPGEVPAPRPHEAARAPVLIARGRRVDDLTVHPDARDVGGCREREDLRQCLLGTARVAQGDLEDAAAARAHPDRVEPLADAEVAHLVAEAQGARTRGRGEVEEVARLEREPLLAEHLLDEVGLQPFLEQAET